MIDNSLEGVLWCLPELGSGVPDIFGSQVQQWSHFFSVVIWDKTPLVLATLVTSTLTTYLTPYATLVHQGKGTKYPR